MLGWAELLSKAIEFCELKLNQHRKGVNVCCAEDCWCWDIEDLLIEYEIWLEK